MLILLALHAVVGLTVLATAHRLGRIGYLVATVPMAATLVLVVLEWNSVLAGSPRVDRHEWVPGLDLVLSSRLDAFALLMVLLVAGVGVLVLVYSAAYFRSPATGVRIAALLVLFGGSMLGVVTADNLLWLYVCWELTSVTSYLLIGWTQERAEQRAAAREALLTTAAGGLALLAGFAILADAAGTWSLSTMLDAPPSGGAVPAGLALVVLGAMTKSAQVPFHFWLPSAMAAPTPISAYLHSATMVKAGIYVVARFAAAFGDVGVWRPTLVAVGLVTMVHAGVRALRQFDMKLVLAYGTVSQLGFMLVLAGSGEPKATKALVVLLLAHGLFKGALFFVVGAVDHHMGTRDLRDLHGFGSGWTGIRWVALLSGASMAGLPPVLGFVSKESAYAAFADAGAARALVLGGLVLGSMITFAYTLRVLRPFLPGAHVRDVRRVSPGLVGPSVVLATGTVATGLTLPALRPLVEGAGNALDPRLGAVDLKLWHGVNLPLVLSAVTIAGGLAIHALRPRFEPRLERLASDRLTADGAFTALIAGLNSTARQVARFAQPGSLPVYLGVTLAVVVAGPTLVLALDPAMPPWPALADVPAQLLLAVMLSISAVAVAVLRRRFAAVLALGAVGYLMATIFVVQGASDLALTQFAVETLFVVIFVLVIRHLPEEFRRAPGRTTQALRVCTAVGVGAGVFLIAIMTGSGTAERAVGDEITMRAQPDGGGKNVVNIVLVDVRGLDTLGEVAVLASASVGVAAVARVGRRGRSAALGPPDEVIES